MALYQGVLSSSNLRLRGYRVTNGLNFFFNFLSNVRLRGYRVTNRLNFLSLNFQNEKVTRLPGLQGLQWATRLNLIFFKLTHPRLRGYRVSKVTWLRNCKILHISCHIYISSTEIGSNESMHSTFVLCFTCIACCTYLHLLFVLIVLNFGKVASPCQKG